MNKYSASKKQYAKRVMKYGDPYHGKITDNSHNKSFAPSVQEAKLKVPNGAIVYNPNQSSTISRSINPDNYTEYLKKRVKRGIRT